VPNGTPESAAPYAYYEDVNWGLLRLWGDRSGAAILDVGCGFATTSERLRRLGNRVTGIESSPAAVAKATERLDEVIAADLRQREEIAARLSGRTFDVVMFADVLEHLDWPGPILKSYLPYVKPGGSVIISLPNVGNWSSRFGLLGGRFEYTDTGVLDRTHLRFFTRNSARRLIEDAGLTIARHAYTPGIVRPLVPVAKKLMAPRASGDGGAHDPAALLESAPYRVYVKAVYPVESFVANLWPGLLAFQMIYEAHPS
jgi:2-polyprenyl-3-methyl-5-hydroxy-6-metoxy-1,4-benzoquinol methylase